MQGNYIDGEREGFWKGLWAREDSGGDWGLFPGNGSFKEDMPEGEWRYYRANGVLKEKGSYEKGKETGFWEKYDSGGIVNLIFYSEKGEPLTLFFLLEIATRIPEKIFSKLIKQKTL